VVFAQGLSAGDNQTTALNTGVLPIGVYRIGINVTSDGQTLRVFSTGTITITTLPDPDFTLPNQNLTAQPGGNIDISANVGDAENAVQWRIFYVANGSRPSAEADAYGTLIGTGTANVAQATWFTAGVPLGEYEIGIFVTDSGQSIAQTVASGNADAIKGPFFNPYIVTLSEEEPDAVPPSLVISQPSSNRNILVDPAAPDDAVVPVEYAVTTFQGPTDDQYIQVFWDYDGIANTGDEQIFADEDIDSTRTNFLVRLIPEVGTTAFIGVTAHDLVTNPVTRYAAGTVRRASFDETVFNVTAPAVDLEVAPGAQVQARWSLNAPKDATGSISVYLRRLSGAGDDAEPVNATLVAADLVTNGLPLTESTFPVGIVDLVSNQPTSGRFIITVKVEIDGDTETFESTSLGTIIATSLPEIFWLGEIGRANPSRFGAIFGGVNPEDNAGSSFTGGEDFNDDGIDDFIIVSRYAKPDSLNPTGVGIGEAYLIRGSTGMLNREFNLNTVSTTQLPGMAFTGIPIVSSTTSDETYGIASVFISTDADNDEMGEIWFGIPFANSEVPNVDGLTLAERRIERPAMFVHGGVVCVSSTNTRVQGFNETGGDTDTHGGVIRLDEVGMRYESNWIAPNYFDAGFQNGTERTCGWFLQDLLVYYEGECPTGEAMSEQPYVGCVSTENGLIGDTTDGGPDTLVGPQPGFSPVLAVNFIDSVFSCPFVSTLCPSCVPGDGASCNGSCVPWGLSSVMGYALGGAFLSHTTLEPLDQSDPNNDYCYGLGDDVGEIEIEQSNVVENLSPGTVELPTPADLDCAALKTSYQFKIANPASIYDLFGPSVASYQGNMATGVIRQGRTSMTGFYTWAYRDSVLTDPIPNLPKRPYGMRIIGRPPTSGVFEDADMIPHDHEEFSLFGNTITQVDNLMLVSAPQRDAIQIEGVGFDATDFLPGVEEIENSGLLYGFDNFAYWLEATEANQSLGRVGDIGEELVPPRPHMFLAGGGGNNGNDYTYDDDDGSLIRTRHTWRMTFARDDVVTYEPPVVVGGEDEQIDLVVPVGDFNNDSRNDYAIGSPNHDGGDGAVYVVVRRAPALEGDVILDKLALATNASERLSGALFIGDPGEGEEFGHAIASDVDLNGDNVGDIIVGVPNASGGVGEVIIIFSQSGIVTPIDGVSVDTLLEQRQGARITGSTLDIGSEFGFTVSSAGDIDQDGKNDLLIAAPSATPRFDPDSSDAFDELTEFGIDINRDGEQDDVTGPFGSPDGVVNGDDDLVHAGLVYVILSSANAYAWTSTTPGIFDISIDDLGTPELPGFIIVGRNGERSSAAGSNIDGDYLGGGNSANIAQGGSLVKAPIPGVDFDRGQGKGMTAVGDVNGDGFGDFLLGAQLADPRVNPQTGEGVRNAGEAYLIFGQAE
jgi:hypothetical protein